MKTKLLKFFIAASLFTLGGQALGEAPKTLQTGTPHAKAKADAPRAKPENLKSTKEKETTPPSPQSDDIRSISASINEISKKIDDLPKNSWLEKSTPAIFGFLGIIIGGILNFFLQKNQLNHNIKERKEKSYFETKQKIFEYKNRQINEFYAPLLVLLTQSKELSSQLYSQLIKTAPNRYQFQPEHNEAIDEKALHIVEPNQEAHTFRLIEELPYLGENHENLLPIVGIIIETGNRMARLIEEKSGLAIPYNIELNGCLGRYLAHLSALKDAYSQAKEKRKSSNIRTHSASFPREIQSLTRHDYDLICREINSWEVEATKREAQS